MRKINYNIGTRLFCLLLFAAWLLVSLCNFLSYSRIFLRQVSCNNLNQSSWHDMARKKFPFVYKCSNINISNWLYTLHTKKYKYYKDLVMYCRFETLHISAQSSTGIKFLNIFQILALANTHYRKRVFSLQRYAVCCHKMNVARTPLTFRLYWLCNRVWRNSA